MNEPIRDQIELPDDESGTEVPHGQPQGLAIATVILGPLSFLALFKTLFWGIPIVATALGIVSLMTLKQNPQKIGRKAAIFGLALAIFFGSWAATRYFSRQQWLYGHARRNAEIWLEMVRENKLREAHQLSLRKDERVSPEVSLEEFYKKEQMAWEDYDSLFGSDPMKTFVEVAPEATIRFEGLKEYQPGEMFNDLVLQYVAEYQEDGKQQELAMDLTVRRFGNPMNGECSWQIYRVSPGDEGVRTPQLQPPRLQ